MRRGLAGLWPSAHRPPDRQIDDVEDIGAGEAVSTNCERQALRLVASIEIATTWSLLMRAASFTKLLRRPWAHATKLSQKLLVRISHCVP